MKNDLDDLLSSVAAAYSEVRHKKKLSLNVVSQRCGVSRQSIKKIEEGKRNSGVLTLALVAEKGLGVSLWKMIRDAQALKKTP